MASAVQSLGAKADRDRHLHCSASEEGRHRHEVVTITITGTNDAAAISGQHDGRHTKNALSASGTSAVTDIDTGEAE